MPSCSVCSANLKYIGGPSKAFSPSIKIVGTEDTFDSLDQWQGSLCLDCQLIFCIRCLHKSWSFPPCPKCGGDTKPVFKYHLAKISPRGVRVLEQERLELDASTVEDAKKEVRDILSGRKDHWQSSKNIFPVLQWDRVARGIKKTIRGSGDTLKKAIENAQSSIPKGGVIVKEEVLYPPREDVITVSAFDESMVLKGPDLKGYKETMIKNIVKKSKGKKGILGIGRKPDIYEVRVLNQALVEIIYREKSRFSVNIKKCEIINA